MASRRLTKTAPFLERRGFLARTGGAAAGLWLAPRGLWSSDDDRLAALAARVPEWLWEQHVAGAAVAVVHGGRPTWARGFGTRDRAAQGAVDETTVFQAASLSKPVFAYAVLTLAAEGRLDLDRPLVQFLPHPFRSRLPRLMASDVPARDDRLGRITPRMVLAHTTGLPNWSRGKPLALLADPGRRFGYSGEGYVYLQNVVEHVSGEPLDEFARRRVLAPLGLTSSSFVWRDDYETRAAIGHTRRGPEEKWKPREPLAAGTLHTTAADYARFLAAVLHPAGAGRGLGAEWVDRMLTPQSRIDSALGWGLGWGLERSAAGRHFWQWGDDGEFKAFAMGSRDAQQAVVVLTNSASGLNLCRSVVEHVLPGPHPALSFPMLEYERRPK